MVAARPGTVEATLSHPSADDVPLHREAVIAAGTVSAMEAAISSLEWSEADRLRGCYA
jgi:hypothetical protein